jgi:hypothetical protein
VAARRRSVFRRAGPEKQKRTGGVRFHGAGCLLVVVYLPAELSEDAMPNLASINRSESSVSASARWKA